MQIAIASGKGGTGKTTLSVNLAARLCRTGHTVTLADCDVEEPNSHIFLSPAWTRTDEAHAPVPRIIQDRCVGTDCRICVNECRFKALAWMGEVMDFPELCHGCGLCMEACPAGAIVEASRVMGIINHGTADTGNGSSLRMLSGTLRIGEAMSPPLIRSLLEEAASPPYTEGIVLRDCPPGTSCPVITSLEGADYTILVTEPTPFGMHDLRLAVQTLRLLGQPFGVVVNRDGMSAEQEGTVLDGWLLEEHIPVLARFPYSRAAASACAEGTLLIDALPETTARYDALWKEVLTQMTRATGGSLHA
ncbi:ATP-binding protein [Desulfovibrio mangrovi]|uniref:ATP-binding protein n=1 Tax=Desulfovibrio mangrovi TaxID=2976983 RepID=UPI0022464B33|nr:ATP-binding protein [Desulfovibrio mangrovi]UZP67435.1 ATP-binding protein [Desulfovibrio mangrovi]